MGDMGEMLNTHVARALEGSFGSSIDSDCVVTFHREHPITEERDDEEQPAKRARVDDSGGIFGEPIPAHKCVLRHASERFRVQLERWQTDCDGPSLETSCPPPVPGGGVTDAGSFVFRVPLASEAEVPAARAAIAFAYTGRVQVGSIREALEVRRQAAYLQIEGCTAACDEWIKEQLAQANGAAVARAQAGSSNGGDNDAQAVPVLELYACVGLWPHTEPGDSFSQVLTTAKRQLLSHFQDALSILKTPSLRQQLLDLPAEALAALLESDDFATDSESTVLLLLATWMEHNYSSTDAATRQRLCRLVRLVQLSRPYLHLVLPALALDHETKPEQQVGWFAVGLMEAAFITQYAYMSQPAGEEKPFFSTTSPPYDSKQPTYSRTARAQPSSFVCTWTISEPDLQEALADMTPGKSRSVRPKFESTTAVDRIYFQGLSWRGSLQFISGQTAAGLYIWCILPKALRLDASTLSTLSTRSTEGFCVCVNARLTVNRPGRPSKTPKYYTLHNSRCQIGMGIGTTKLVSLRQQTEAATSDCDVPARGDAGGGQEGGGDRIPLAALADYLHEGKMTGTVALLWD